MDQNKKCQYRGCKNPLENNRKKYCNASCQYWENQCKKDETNPRKLNKSQQLRMDKAMNRMQKARRSGKNMVRYN